MDVYLFASFGIIGKTIRLLNWFLIAAPVIPLHWENCDLQKPFLTAASNLSKTKTSQELCVVLVFFQQLWLNWIPSLVLTFEQLREILSCVGLTCLGDQELANYPHQQTHPSSHLFPPKFLFKKFFSSSILDLRAPLILRTKLYLFFHEETTQLILANHLFS